MKIAVLLTCHNRRKKTGNCLKGLKIATESYNARVEEKVYIEIFLTDDGCTDGTAEAAYEVFPDKQVLHILRGDGNLYWAGGMRFCWHEAMKWHAKWDYYLLLNDDTVLKENLFEELFNAESFSVNEFGMLGLVSGITCASDDETKLTYGGDIWVNRFLATKKRLVPNGLPQSCDLTNANILLVPKSVVDKIGIFHEGFQHGIADNDYSNTARKSGIPVVLTASFCGVCDDDHLDYSSLAEKIMAMSLNERKKFFSSPLHSSKDYLLFVWRTSPFRWPLVYLGRMMNLYFPKFYYMMSIRRM